MRLRFRGSDDGVSWSDWVAEPGSLQRPSPRFVMVDVALVAGDDGASPRLVSMGFRTDPKSGTMAADDLRVLPIAPYDPGTTR